MIYEKLGIFYLAVGTLNQILVIEILYLYYIVMFSKR
jgi:hypothetical protein